METIIYTPDTIRGSRRGESSIRFNRKTAICITKEAVTAIGLESGDRIALVHEDNDWYIILKADGFSLRTHTSEKSMQFNCAALANKVLDSLKLEGRSYSMKVSEGSTTLKDGTTAWCIITASAKE